MPQTQWILLPESSNWGAFQAGNQLARRPTLRHSKVNFSCMPGEIEAGRPDVLNDNLRGLAAARALPVQTGQLISWTIGPAS